MSETMMHMTTLLHKYLAPTGDSYDFLTREDRLDIAEVCDGYGELTKIALETLQLEYDWSHVRDLSDGALKNAYDVLTDILNERWGK